MDGMHDRRGALRGDTRGMALPILLVLAAACGLAMSLTPPASGDEPTAADRNAWDADTRGAIPKIRTPPVLDGVIHADEWRESAEFSAQLDQGAGHNLYPREVIWHLAWDDTNIFVASRTVLLANEVPKRNARSSVGSQVMLDDTLEMWLDPKGRNSGTELPSYFQSMINAIGITYFCRLFPSVAARSDDWRPDWKIASKTHDGLLDFEIQMPIKDFALTEPNKAGDDWGMMLARNFMFENWNQSPMAYAFPGFGFAVHTFYPRMTLGDGDLYVKFRDPQPLFDGKAFAGAEVINPSGAAKKASVRLAISKLGQKPDDRPTQIFERTEAIEIPLKGATMFAADDAIQPPIDVAESAVYRYDFSVSDEAGKEVFHCHFKYNPTVGRDWIGKTFPPPKQVKAWTAFNPVRSILEWNVDVIDFPRKKDVAAARVIAIDAGGEPIGESSLPVAFNDLYRGLLQLPSLPSGKYSWKAFVVMKDGTEVAAAEALADNGVFEKKDEATAFPWWGTKLGDAEKVLWPYTAVKAEAGGAVVKAWGKEVELDGLALPKKITSTGNSDKWPRGRAGQPDVLAAAIRIDAVIDGKAVAVACADKPTIRSASDHRITLAGAAAAGPLRISTMTTLEQDGAYFVDMTLAPARSGDTVKVDALDLVIPLRSDVATFLNAYAHCGYSGYYIDWVAKKPMGGQKTDGRFKVWDASLNGPPSVTVGDFIPQIWMGNEFAGLLWYADNDRGWTPRDGVHSQEIFREGDQVSLVHHIISVPIEMQDERTIRFVIQPTPIRPLTPGWRMLNCNFSQSFLPWDAMGRSSAAYSAMVNLANDDCYAKSKAFSEKWPGPKAEIPTLAMYFAPHTESSDVMTGIWPDRNYFGAEWLGGSYTETLNDHTLWHINKWVEKGGLQGLYHDQFYPHRNTSVTTGLAYFLPDGQVQPGFALTTRRRFVMREHALWLEKGIMPPRTLTHATNGGPLGSVGWVESFLDGEDKMINKNMPIDFADTWSSDRIRAGSISYNLGTTFAWMRLIDTAGMTPEQKSAHTRTYVGHCMMHDVMNALEFNDKNTFSALVSWGLNDDAVFFWPHWSNADVLSSSDRDVKVTAWTLPDRMLLCVMNYSKDRESECTVQFKAGGLGLSLPTKRRAVDIETGKDQTVSESKGTCTVGCSVKPRDFRLISIEAAQGLSAGGGTP